MFEYGLVLNAGSSSLKFGVYRRPEGALWTLESRGQIDGIGGSPKLTAKDGGGASIVDRRLEVAVRDGRAALHELAEWLRAQYAGAKVIAVGHRVVHGGARFAEPCVVTPEVVAELRKLVPLAPLHQPFNVGAIEAATERLPGVPQVACFDTSFHRGRSRVAELVPLPKEIRDGGVQRYGFHGLSYESIASVLPEVAPGIAEGRVIVAHLGSGASLCALRGGRSVDSSLGFTLNGKEFPYTQPILANKGDRIRVRYMNEGLMIHPMHLHGIPQLVIAKDGYNLPVPYKVDTLCIAPGERYDTIVECTEPGLWAFHCHILTHAESRHGMFGMVTVLGVQDV